MAYPKRKESSGDDAASGEARPPGPVLVEDERIPRTAADSAGSKPPRVPPGVRATDFAPNPEPDPAHSFLANLGSRAPRLRYFSFLPGMVAAVIIVLYLVVLLSVLITMQLRP